MGSRAALLALLLVVCLTSGVWSLNPDDPNVCSHWERWALSSVVFATLHWISDWRWGIRCGFGSSGSKKKAPNDPGTFSVHLLHTLSKFRIYPQSPYGHIDLTRLESPSADVGGAAASNEIRREIDQCTLIPINHDSQRAWIIISCAGQCHLWEISRNNFCPQCEGEERKPWRYIIWIIAWPRWRCSGIVVPPCWHRDEFLKCAAFMALRSPNIIRLSQAAYITDMNHLKASFKSSLCISKLLYCFHLDYIHWQALCV